MQCSNWGLSSEVEQNNYLISFTRDILINVTQYRAFALFCHSAALLIHIQIISHSKSPYCSVGLCANTGYPTAANRSTQELQCGCWALYKKEIGNVSSQPDCWALYSSVITGFAEDLRYYKYIPIVSDFRLLSPVYNTSSFVTSIFQK